MASKYADLVNREADEAEAEEEEAETPESAPEPEPEPTPEPAPEPAPDEGKMMRAVERVHTRYERELAKVPGLAFDAYVPCEACGSMGYVLPSDQVEPEFKQAPDKETCPECDGYGLVVSGAKNENHALEQCTKCNGNGWVMRARDMPVYTPAGSLTPAVSSNQSAPFGNGQAGAPGVPDDSWGRPFGHPHYGVPPASVGVGS